MTQFTDALPFSALKRSADGYATVVANVARAGNVQLYRGSELGFKDREFVRVYRPEDEVFKLDAIKTYAGVPVTLGHPPVKVTADNWKQYAVGEIGEEVLRDGARVKVPMILRDAATIAQVEAGTRELSMGYDAKVELTEGVNDAGEAYDAVMSNFRMNHVAVVPVARGGSELRIGDGAEHWGACPVTDATKEQSMTLNLRTVVVGDRAFQTTDEGAQAVDLLKGMLKDAAAKAKEDEDEANKKLAAKDAELAAKDAALADANAKVLSDAALDARVKDRAALVAKAKAVAPAVVVDGLSDADIRKAVLVARLGDEAIKDKPQAYIDAYFDIVADKAITVDPVRGAVLDGLKPAPAVATTVADAHRAYRDDMSTAWMKKGN